MINRIAAYCALLTLLISGCLTPGELTPTQFFALDPRPEVETFDRGQLTLGIRRLAVARPYKQPMAYREGLDVGFRTRESWAESPDVMVTRAVTDAIIASGRFADAGNASEMNRPSLILTGELRKFHEDRGTTPGAAEIEVRLELRRLQDTEALWAETLHERIEMGGADARAFAAAMSQAVARIAQRAALGIANSL